MKIIIPLSISTDLFLFSITYSLLEEISFISSSTKRANSIKTTF